MKSRFDSRGQKGHQPRPARDFCTEGQSESSRQKNRREKE